ncbi:MAG: metallophosphoesterase [Gemmataceae bacterium]|nr:metallophosphoesterase [Gemmataceae bacterium]MDW8266242.1 metallophosphoesterase [Gemmataceae bacterium]
MKRSLLAVTTLGVVLAAVAFSGPQGPRPEFQIASEERNPWTHLRLNNDPDEFHFAIVSDRTGGHRSQIFSRAVQQLNLLQPQFVLSVGDLIEGYSENMERLAAEWREFQGYVGQLQMPFFYVPGNHDLSNLVQEKLWTEKFGRRYYHFVYRNVLFLLLNSEDPPGVSTGHFSEEQVAYVRKVLEENRDVRWTIVAFHKPVWADAQVAKTNWLEIEQALAGRPYTVFAGHVHRYRKFIRNGQAYYQLATTGGVSKMRGRDYGEFDHIVWVTMKKDGPVLANIMLDGIYPENLKSIETGEEGMPRTNLQPVHPVRGRVYCEGTPVAHALVTFHALSEEKRPARTADAITAADGSFVLSTYTANDGAPVGEYVVTVAPWRPVAEDGARSANFFVPAKFASPASSNLRVKVQAGSNTFHIDLR